MLAQARSADGAGPREDHAQPAAALVGGRATVVTDGHLHEEPEENDDDEVGSDVHGCAVRPGERVEPTQGDPQPTTSRVDRG